MVFGTSTKEGFLFIFKNSSKILFREEQMFHVAFLPGAVEVSFCLDCLAASHLESLLNTT
jgi:hypothetical protein